MIFPNRKPQRLPGYNYAENAIYFLTICTHQKADLFGKVLNTGVVLSDLGQIARNDLVLIPKHFDGVQIDKYIIMPNHIHLVLVLDRYHVTDTDKERSRPFPTVSTIIGLFKSGVSNKIHHKQPGLIVWQKSFYDRIIRNESEYYQVLEYIDQNPIRWAEDKYYPQKYNTASLRK